MAGVTRVPSQFIFATEALRDAAITAPVEGQQAYITASTVAAATGAITAVPSGVQTIYNGSAWVCVTEVGARSETSGDTTSTSFTSTLTGDATAVSVTLVTGATALVSIHFQGFTNTAAVSVMAVAVSGASTIAATQGKGVIHNDISNAAATSLSHGSSFVFTGLTAGTNVFTAQYKTSAGTATFANARTLSVRGIA